MIELVHSGKWANGKFGDGKNQCEWGDLDDDVCDGAIRKII